MDLKEFVTETIVQIISGVAEAQKQSEEFGAHVSPKLTGSSSHKEHKQDTHLNCLGVNFRFSRIGGELQ